MPFPHVSDELKTATGPTDRQTQTDSRCNTVLVDRSSDPNQKLMIIQNRVEHLCKFLNKYILNKTLDGGLNHSSPVKIGFPKSTYKVRVRVRVRF